MKNNLKEIKTTVIGSILFIIGVSILGYEYFTISELSWDHYMLPLVLSGCGIGFLLAPDRLLDFLFGWLSKKTQ